MLRYVRQATREDKRFYYEKSGGETKSRADACALGTKQYNVRRCRCGDKRRVAPCESGEPTLLGGEMVVVLSVPTRKSQASIGEF